MSDNDVRDDAADLSAAATEGTQPRTLPAHIRAHASYQLEMAAGLIKDTTPECEAWNLKEASGCIRSALRALAWGGDR